MPLDTSIPLQIGRAPQTQALDPMTMYNAMQERQMNALRAQALQQTMAQNALTMQNTMEDRRIAAAARGQAAAAAAEERRRLGEYRGVLGNFGTTPAAVGQRGAGYSGTGVSTDPYAYVQNELLRRGFVPQAEEIAKVQKEQLAGQETAAKIPGLKAVSSKQEVELADAQLKQFGMNIDRAPTIEAVDMLFDSNPAAVMAAGSTPDKSKAMFRQRVAEVGFDRARMEVANGVMAVQKQFSDQFKTLETPQGILEYEPGTGKARRIMVQGAPNEVGQIAMPADKRSITTINTVDTASEAAMKEYMKDTAEQRKMYASAPAVLENIEKSKALIPDAKKFMGTGGEGMLEFTKFFNNRVGTEINTKGVTSAEELRSRLFMGVMDNLKKMDSQPTQQQQIALQEAVGKLGTDPSALPQVLDIMADALRAKIDLYNADVTEAEKRGVKFPFKPQIELPAKKSAAATDSLSVTTPNGKVYSFPTPEAAAQFKKAAGIP